MRVNYFLAALGETHAAHGRHHGQVLDSATRRSAVPMPLGASAGARQAADTGERALPWGRTASSRNRIERPVCGARSRRMRATLARSGRGVTGSACGPLQFRRVLWLPCGEIRRMTPRGPGGWSATERGTCRYGRCSRHRRPPAWWRSRGGRWEEAVGVGARIGVGGEDAGVTHAPSPRARGART